MKRPARLILIRHAESARNVAKKGNVFFADDEGRRALRGVPDDQIPLTDEGRRQARTSGVALRRLYGHCDYVYHSGYRRTIETAECLLEAWPSSERAAIQIRRNVFIRERDTGYAYDMTTAEAELAFPWLQEYWRTSGPFFARPPGGESVAQVCERVHLFLEMLWRERLGQRLLVVTHGVTLRAFRFLLERWDYDQMAASLHSDPPANCGLSVYEYDPPTERLVLREANRVLWPGGP